MNKEAKAKRVQRGTKLNREQRREIASHAVAEVLRKRALKLKRRIRKVVTS